MKKPKLKSPHPYTKSAICLALLAAPGLALATSSTCPLYHVSIERAFDDGANDGHGPEYTIDHNLLDGSRWSSPGQGKQITYDLGQSKPINQIDIAFFQAEVRSTFFELDVSDDGKQWHRVLDKTQSSGNKAGFEAFPFEATKARYVRLTGYGNSNPDSAKWNSILEARVMSCTEDPALKGQEISYVRPAELSPKDQKLSGEEVTFRPALYGHATVYPDNQIVDEQFSILGNDAPKGVLYRDEAAGVDGTPAYQFRLNAGRRIELSTAYVTESMAKEYDAEFIETLLDIEDLYRLANLGDYGDTITYEWSIRFPNLPQNGHEGIIAQWHGRPDKTLTRDPEGNIKYNTPQEMAELRKTMDISAEVDQGVGYVKGTKEQNGWYVDSYQRPIGELMVSDGYLYLFFRNDPHRLSGTDADSPVPHPGKHQLPYTKLGNGVSATIVWERPVSELKADEWMNLKLEVKYATYADKEDRVLESGHAKFWVNGELEADYQGPIGKNDKFAPYYQFGVYTGKGMQIDHSNYKFFVNGEAWFGPSGPKKVAKN